MKVTITGASGLIGSAVAASLAASGHQVNRVSLRADPPPEAFAADAVVHLAGEPVAQRWTDAAKQKIRSSRVEGTRSVVDCIARSSARPSVLVSASAVGIYGDRANETLNEASRPGTGFLAEVCQAWEAEALRAEPLGVRVVPVRFGVVLARDGGALRKMLPAFRAGGGGRLASGEQWMSWIHIADVVALIEFILESFGIHGPVNFTAPAAVRNSEFTQTLAGVLHRPAFATVPALALKLLFGEMASMLITGQRVLPDAATRAGYTYRFPELESALRDLL